MLSQRRDRKHSQCQFPKGKAQLPGWGKVVDASARFLGALVASTWSTKITDSEDSDAENELSDTLPENILELFNSDTTR
ncbi:uncharacterized protein TNCV_4983041 [Trichonephila clavipes]|uniref:Uncharacterized protein n=1 Tax=Trichonephila clavipes TaxID=2585209 RepID=A0A8X6WH82_TRICX|nr:uncharacterized protein TNCV_4983041 [Trichonephila clavipes]